MTRLVLVQEVFDIIRDLRDPEYPLTLEELRVVSLAHIHVDNGARVISVMYTPTVPHCSQATLIGLMIKAVLFWSVPGCYRSNVFITPGTHTSESSINKQLADKGGVLVVPQVQSNLIFAERVLAALENVNVLQMIMRGCSKTRSIDSAVSRCLEL